METNTIRLYRVLKASPDKVYKAFLDPAAMCKWLPPHGFTGTVDHVDAVIAKLLNWDFAAENLAKSHG